MKNTTKAGIALALGTSLAGSLTFATLTFAAPVQRGPSGSPSPAATTATTPAVASAALTKDLTLMREEERLARDLYIALADAHGGAAPMVNIKNAEQKHYDAIGVLLTRYGVADPSAGKAPGAYAIPEIQEMYDTLLAQGKKSLADAYDVGIAIEKADIADLTEVIARTSEPDAKRVFENLLRGSENHLAAFEAAKAGKTIGAQDGTGMQNGRQGAQGGQGMAGRGAGAGACDGTCDGSADGTGVQAGPRQAERQAQGAQVQGGQGRQGRGMGTGDPADCPIS